MIFLRMLTFNLPICQLGWESFVASMAFELGSCEFRELGSDLPKALTIRIECCVNFPIRLRPLVYVCLIS